MTHVNDSHIVEEVHLTPLRSDGDLILVNAMQQPPKTFLGGYWLFIVMVIIPVIVAGIYLFVIASDRFVSKAQFIIRSESGAGLESAAGMISSRGFSQAHDEAYVVDEFIRSRDALAWLVKSANLRDCFSRSQADFLNRYPSIFARDNEESLFRYYRSMVSSDVDNSTGISTISVTAFTPQDAQRISAELLRASEALINRLNERSESDAVKLAKRTVADARQQMDYVESRLKDYRSEAGFVDPTRESASELKTVTKLSTDLAQLRAELQRNLAVTPNGPSISAMKAKIAAYESEILLRKEKMAGDKVSLASRMSGYDELVFEKTLVEKAWAKAEAALVSARANSARQHLYLQAIVEPNCPDVATYPRRILDLFITAVVAFMAFSIVRALRQFAIEHAL